MKGQSIEAVLEAEAAQLRDGLQAQAQALQTELREIEARNAEIEANLDAARGSQQRFIEFRTLLGSEALCPVCWMTRGRRFVLRPFGGDDSINQYRCPECSHETENPIK